MPDVNVSPSSRLHILVLGGPPWRGDVNQPATQMARALRRAGHDVVYLCRPRQSSWLRGMEGRGARRRTPWATDDGIHIEYVTGLPEVAPLSAPLLRRIQAGFLMRSVARAVQRHGAFDVTLLYWWFFPEVVPLLPGEVVYDAIDEHHAYPVNRRWKAHNRRTLRWEAQTAAAASAVCTVSRAALPRLQEAKPSACLLPNGIDITLLSEMSRELLALPVHPRRVVYAGGIGNRIDWPLVAALCAARPEYEFVFAGGGEHPTDLPENARFLGRMGYQDILRQTAAGAVAIIPFVDDEFTRGSDFLKGYDYLALNKRIVASRLPSLLRLAEMFPQHVRTAAGEQEWLVALDDAILSAGTDVLHPDLRRVSTDARARDLLRLVTQSIDSY